MLWIFPKKKAQLPPPLSAQRGQQGIQHRPGLGPEILLPPLDRTEGKPVKGGEENGIRHTGIRPGKILPSKHALTGQNGQRLGKQCRLAVINRLLPRPDRGGELAQLGMVLEVKGIVLRACSMSSRKASSSSMVRGGS